MPDTKKKSHRSAPYYTYMSSHYVADFGATRAKGGANGEVILRWAVPRGRAHDMRKSSCVTGLARKKKKTKKCQLCHRPGRRTKILKSECTGVFVIYRQYREHFYYESCHVAQPQVTMEQARSLLTNWGEDQVSPHITFLQPLHHLEAFGAKLVKEPRRNLCSPSRVLASSQVNLRLQTPTGEKL